ncbi:hypothetical protein RB597_008167 [Gaeumannomyces tritici]
MPSPHTVFAHPVGAATAPPPALFVSASTPFVGLPPSGPPPSAPPPPIPIPQGAAAALRRPSTPGSRASSRTSNRDDGSPRLSYASPPSGVSAAVSTGGPQTALSAGSRQSAVSANASARASASPDAVAPATRAGPAAPNPSLRTAAAKPYLGLQQQNSQPPYFHAVQLPRTSSLLPPPNLVSSDQNNRHTTSSTSSTTTTAATAASTLPPRSSYQNYQHQHRQQQQQQLHQHQQHQQLHQVLFQNPFNAQPIAPGGSDREELFLLPQQSRSPSQPRPNHSRSSSTNGLGDGFRALNRWSASTSSSRASANFAGRRQSSIDSFGVHTHPAPIPQLSQAQFQQEFQPLGAYGSPPRKLQKQRPSISNGSASGSRVRRLSPSPTPVPPLESLPPIIALPSLEQEVSAGTLASSDPPPAALDDARRSRRDSQLLGNPAHDSGDQSLRPGDGQYHRSHARNSSDATMTMYDRNGSAHERGHSRNRSQANKGSADTTASSKSKERSSKQPSQKAMLSRALEKANTAVQLDNARNFEGARQAYAEACDLLHQVLVRTNGEDDKKKLEAISKTYTTRIEELDDILPDQTQLGKALPSRPPGHGQREELSLYSAVNSDDEAPVRTTTFSHSSSSFRDRDSHPSPGYAPPSGHRRQPSGGAASNASATNSRFGSFSAQGGQPVLLQSAFSQPFRKDSNTLDVTPMRPMDSQYMPPPLSPRRLPPGPQSGGTSPGFPGRSDFSMPTSRLNAPEHPTFTRGHSRGNSHESISWLDPIDESGGSNASSVQSRSSSLGVQRKHFRSTSGDTEAEFDAALDDAIEAAYDEGYDAEVASLRRHPDDGEDVVARAMRKVELAKERVRESEREALELANDREKRLREQLRLEDEADPEDFFEDDNDSEEEERILEEMTRGYAIEEFSFGVQQPQKPAMPRTSDSSEFTARTWHTSTGSNPPTATTVLTTVSENGGLPSVVKVSAPLAPPPTQALPQLPPQRPGSSGVQSSGGNHENKPTDQSVRSRRLSGQNPKQLKIETTQLGKQPSGTIQPVTMGNQLANTPPLPSQQTQPPLPKATGFIAQQRQALSTGAGRTMPFKQAPSPLLPMEQFPPPTPPIPQGVASESEPRSGSPSVAKPPALRKNFSSSSLRSMKGRNVSVTNFDDGSDMSPSTPMSTHFGPLSTRLPAVPSMPTPVAAAFKDRLAPGSTGMFLFDADIHGPTSPGSLRSIRVDAPVPLEPCPTDTLLRPFWLMRCLYQTLAHPRGGYISSKLFVPRDVWRVKGVKLKNVEDKVSNCDFLTAALQKLSMVDTIDADAVLEEMQSLEGIFEQVQATLTRRLGNEVGVQSMGALFRDATGGTDGDPGSAVPRSSSVTGKSSFSWRRLRSKNSSAGLANSYAGGGSKKDASPGLFDGVRDISSASASLPMTAHPTSKPPKREVTSLQFTGPNANYMSSLAKLFDAAQVIGKPAPRACEIRTRHSTRLLTQVNPRLQTRSRARSKTPASATLTRPRSAWNSARATPRNFSPFTFADSSSRTLPSYWTNLSREGASGCSCDG